MLRFGGAEQKKKDRRKQQRRKEVKIKTTESCSQYRAETKLSLKPKQNKNTNITKKDFRFLLLNLMF